MGDMGRHRTGSPIGDPRLGAQATLATVLGLLALPLLAVLFSGVTGVLNSVLLGGLAGERASAVTALVLHAGVCVAAILLAARVERLAPDLPAVRNGSTRASFWCGVCGLVLGAILFATVCVNGP